MKAITLLALLTVAMLPACAGADRIEDQAHCPQCGCHQLKKVCKLVPEVKKVSRTVYDVKCEDFCVPGKSKLCGTRCVPDADGRGSHREPIWEPSCGCVKTRKVMVSKTIVDEKPGFKCVLETYCCRCGCNCNQVKTDRPASAAQAPTAP
ncbi:MAG TPA: hypothetical protein VG713_11040 [Pirellulales bacterium]|nr:hypothetical protein [Pirellulales bacterium]